MKFLDVPQSGSFGGFTHGHNRAGQYRRNRRTPTNNPTPRRTAARTAFSTATRQFATLTQADQAAWNSFADLHPITDSLGQSIKLTGHQWFVATGAALIQSGAQPNPTPPASTDVFDVSGSSGTFSVATGLSLTFLGNGGTDDFAFIALSGPVSSARTFWNKFSQVGQVAGDATTYTMSTANYALLFGAPSVGQKVFVKITPFNQYGVRGTPKVLQILVTS